MNYNYKDGDCSTSKNIRIGGKGRAAWRYDILQRDGKQTVIHKGVTGRELKIIEAEIIKQRGKSAWWG